MWSIRTAGVSDLPAIYDLQNTVFRSEVMDSELPARDEFLRQKENLLALGEEKLFLLERAGKPEGFLAFSMESGFWHVNVWGAWLKTLVYAAGVAAFDHLQFPRLVFCVREVNRRMVTLCERYEFRLIGRNSVFVTLQEPPYISIARVCYYDITMEEFRLRSEKMRKASLTLQWDWSKNED
jgi:hypothetical protein